MILLLFSFYKRIFDLIQSYLRKSDLKNCEVISDNKIKNYILKKSVFVVSNLVPYH